MPELTTFQTGVIDQCMVEIKELLEAAIPAGGPEVLIEEAGDFVSQLNTTLAKLGSVIVITFESAVESGIQAPGQVYFDEVVFGIFCFRNMALTRGRDMPTTRGMAELICSTLKLARTASGATLRMQRGEAQFDQIRSMPVEDNPSLAAIRVPIVAKLSVPNP